MPTAVGMTMKMRFKRVYFEREGVERLLCITQSASWHRWPERANVIFGGSSALFIVFFWPRPRFFFFFCFQCDFQSRERRKKKSVRRREITSAQTTFGLDKRRGRKGFFYLRCVRLKNRRVGKIFRISKRFVLRFRQLFDRREANPFSGTSNARLKNVAKTSLLQRKERTVFGLSLRKYGYTRVWCAMKVKLVVQS